MKKQKIIRTYPRGWRRTTESLQDAFDEGWTVAHITPLKDSITEYIVEKEVQDE